MGQFVSLKYMKNMQKAINHIKYVAFRERSSDKGYGLFNDRSDHVEVESFINSLNDKRIIHEDIAKIHTMIFSMSGNEWERGCYQDGDWQKMIRNVMEDWQNEKGFKVQWCAGLHDEKGHPHIHVIIKSVMIDPNGIERRLNIKINDEREWFKQAMKEEKSRMVKLRGGREPLTREQWILERRRALEKPRLAKGILDNLMFRIQQRLREQEYERQREMDR